MIGTYWENKDHFVLVLEKLGANTWRLFDVYTGCLEFGWFEGDNKGMRIVDGLKYPSLKRVDVEL